MGMRQHQTITRKKTLQLRTTYSFASYSPQKVHLSLLFPFFPKLFEQHGIMSPPPPPSHTLTYALHPQYRMYLVAKKKRKGKTKVTVAFP